MSGYTSGSSVPPSSDEPPTYEGNLTNFLRIILITLSK